MNFKSSKIEVLIFYKGISKAKKTKKTSKKIIESFQYF